MQEDFKIEESGSLNESSQEMKQQEDLGTIDFKGREVGPFLGKLKWNEISIKLDELNSKLSQNERPWRIPTKEEFESVITTLNIVQAHSGLSENEKKDKKRGYIESMGFVWGELYWSSSKAYSDRPYDAWSWEVSNRSVMKELPQSSQLLVRCIR